MPIYYACLINSKRTIITEFTGARFKGDFQSMVLDNHFKFENFAKKVINITAE
jgi:hypothetical protein